MQRVERLITRHEAEIHSILIGSLEALVRDGAVSIVEQITESVPEFVARALAEQAARFASTVLRAERGVIAFVHPLDYSCIVPYLGEAASLEWREDERCSRGEMTLHLSAGTITLCWRDLIEEIVRSRGE